MIDIHPPHEAAHSWRDILIHLATITAGLFIALSLEGCVEWQHHRHLVREARENIRLEIQENQKEIRATLKDADTSQKQLAADSVFLRQTLAKPAHGSMDVHFVFTDLSRTAWETAKVTGAVSFMPYAEVKRYDSLYALDDDFRRAQQQLVDAEAPLIGLLVSMKEQHVSPDDLSKTQVESAIQDVARSQARLFIVKSLADGLDQHYSETLKQSF